MSLGTYICGMAKGSRNVKDSTNYWSNFASVPNEYLYESGGIRRGMWTVSWFKDLLGDDLVHKAARRRRSPEDVHGAHGRGRARRQRRADDDAGLAGRRPDELHRKGRMIGFDGRHAGATIPVDPRGHRPDHEDPHGRHERRSSG